MAVPRLTRETLKVVAAVLERPAERHYGYALSKASGLAPGTIYPILFRLERAGWLVSAWDAGDRSNGTRPRRYYTVTGLGAQAGAAAIAARARPGGLGRAVTS